MMMMMVFIGVISNAVAVRLLITDDAVWAAVVFTLDSSSANDRWWRRTSTCTTEDRFAAAEIGLPQQ